jgi:hypothetical protein
MILPRKNVNNTVATYCTALCCTEEKYPKNASHLSYSLDAEWKLILALGIYFHGLKAGGTYLSKKDVSCTLIKQIRLITFAKKMAERVIKHRLYPNQQLPDKQHQGK